MNEQSTYSLRVNYVDRASIDAEVATNGKWGWLIVIRNEFDPPERWVGLADYASRDEASAAGLAFVVDFYADPERSENPVDSYRLTFLNPIIDVSVVEVGAGRWHFSIDCIEDFLGDRYVGRGVSTGSYETRGQALGAGVRSARWFVDRSGDPPEQFDLTEDVRPRRPGEESLIS